MYMDQSPILKVISHQTSNYAIGIKDGYVYINQHSSVYRANFWPTLHIKTTEKAGQRLINDKALHVCIPFYSLRTIGLVWQHAAITNFTMENVNFACLKRPKTMLQ